MLESESHEDIATTSRACAPKIHITARPPPAPNTHRSMPDDQYERCKGAIREMKRPKHNEYNWPFLTPVDAKAWGAVDYYDVIKRPMDISTLEKNLQENKYTNEEQFHADVKLMFRNCYTYNPEGHLVHGYGKTLEKAYDQYWEKSHKAPQTSKGK